MDVCFLPQSRLAETLRILSGKDNFELRGEPLTSRLSHRSSELRKLARSFTTDQVNGLNNLPSEVQESSAARQGESSQAALHPASGLEAAGRNDGLSMPPEFMVMVRRLEGRFTDNVETSMVADPPVAEAAIPADAEVTENCHSTSASEEDDQGTLRPLSECIAAQSSRLPTSRVISPQLGNYDGEPILGNHVETIEPPLAPALAVNEGISLNAATVATYWQKMAVEGRAAAADRAPFEKPAARGQASPDRNQAMVPSAQSLLEPEVEGIRAGLDALMQSLATVCAERVSADLRNSNKVCIDEVEKKVAELLQASLDSLAENMLDQCRREFDRLVNEFLSKSSLQSDPALVNHRQDCALTQVPGEVKSAAGPQAERRKSRTRSANDLTLRVSVGVIVLVLIPALLAIYGLGPSIARLRQQPPASFYHDDPNWSARQRLREERLARGYWGIALGDIQTRYGFETALPPDPPDNFKVEENAGPSTTPNVDSAARTKYWEKLREVWPRSESWDRTNRLSDWARSFWRPSE